MKKIKVMIIIAFAIITASAFIGCITSRISEKSGSTLWGENCARCHNLPPSTAFSNEQWETIGMHMQLRANLTDDETKKIVDYLKSGQ